jgi:hypothetical protein
MLQKNTNNKPTVLPFVCTKICSSYNNGRTCTKDGVLYYPGQYKLLKDAVPVSSAMKETEYRKKEGLFA